jgi:hypothetical protein
MESVLPICFRLCLVAEKILNIQHLLTQETENMTSRSVSLSWVKFFNFQETPKQMASQVSVFTKIISIFFLIGVFIFIFIISMRVSCDYLNLRVQMGRLYICLEFRC